MGTEKSRTGFDLNPLTHLIERTAALSNYWGPGSSAEGTGNPVALLTKSLEQSRLIANAAAQRQFEITMRAHKRLVDRFAALATARTTQELLSRQLEILTTVADASSEHAAVWAESCRSIRQLCVEAPSTAQANDELEVARSGRTRAPSGQSDSQGDQPVVRAAGNLRYAT